MTDALVGKIVGDEKLFNALLSDLAVDDLARWHRNCVIGARDGKYDESKMATCVEIGRKIQAELTARGADIASILTYTF